MSLSRYRAWDKENSRMVYPSADDVYFELTDDGINILDMSVEPFDDVFPHLDAVLMQSTGLKDKNGVEIFEGDVVSLTEGECSYFGIVVRDYYEFYIKGIGSRDCFDFQDVSNTFDGTTSLEVTTNIYKNPELLEKANEN